mmetsp:Transcript_14760/g.21083  ORF Transcript_14760/g.21083 Transcript_14760/m.21083 type:complete len:165 (+) Transcript_14760:131-625(+)|eukprot:CAMPEP_0184860834 /NCGR_PEP_ID=MMETSP0580-20130426/5647_1 /TAXON_ID=1118495 /ORGANISM="Dactyliosolen fragilissimus" /LENGTH=164 /DNA_ID=CAMNT_0027358089 /DNA_START=40 /DNA_END=534 /DNA_ORIENTATION=+
MTQPSTAKTNNDTKHVQSDPNQSNIRITFLKPSLVKKMLLSHQTKLNPRTKSIPKISNEALELASELLRQFIIEAHHRASVEAEFDSHLEEDQDANKMLLHGEHVDSDDDVSIRNKTDEGIILPSSTDDNEIDKIDLTQAKSPTKLIRKEHCLNIAAELLMDFS